MSPQPEIKMMSKTRRDLLFKGLLFVFIVALPFFIFYTSGYRISFENEGARVVTTGGVYVTTDELDVDVYLNEEQVERPRLFRSAYYIQNIAAGQQRIVVQGEGVQTWVKELPVDPYIVTEVAAFNMPEETLIRPIAEFVSNDNVAIFFTQGTSTNLFPGATTTEPYIVQATRGTTTLQSNGEYDFVVDLFATNTATTTASLISRLEQELSFGDSPAPAATNTSSSSAFAVVEKGEMQLAKRGEEVYAVWTGSQSETPHYFCVNGTASSSLAIRYGAHVAAQVVKERRLLTDPLLIDGLRYCRSEIRIDRKWQKVEQFNFLPGSTDLVVLHLEDGVYVTEIDDRAWQNTQQVYMSDSVEVVVTDTAIYGREGDIYFEIVTELSD